MGDGIKCNDCGVTFRVVCSCPVFYCPVCGSDDIDDAYEDDSEQDGG